MSTVDNTTRELLVGAYTAFNALIEPRTVIKPDPMGALNFAKEHGLPQRPSDEVLRELREGEEE